MGGGRRPLDPQASSRWLGAEEELVLSWLIRRPGVWEAVDLAAAGRQEEALPALARALQGLLGGDPEAPAPAAAADGEAAPEEGARVGAAAAPEAAPAEEPHGAGKRPASDLAEATGDAAASAEGPPTKRLTLSALQRLPATCVCVAVSGLHGCGKSALCNVLREVLGGTWLNYDDFASRHSGKNVRQAFVVELRATLTKTLAQAARDHQAHLVFVDRSHTLRAHRADLLLELRRLQWRKRGGKALIVDFGHTADGYGYGSDGQLSKRYSEQHVAACVGRVEERGGAHPVLQPSPKLRAFLQSAAKAADAPAPEELAQFDGRVSVDVALSPPEAAMAVLEQLRSLGWLPNLRGTDDLKLKTQVAWQAYHRAEAQWRKGAAMDADPAPHEEWITQCRKAVEAEKEKEQAERARVAEEELSKQARECTSQGPPPMYWKLDLPEISGVLSQRGILPSTFTPAAGPHAVLLRLGNGPGYPEEAAAREAGLSLEQFQGMRDALEALQGEELEVRMTEIVIEESIACAVVELPPILPCAAKVPHVTLGMKPGVPAERAAALLEQVKAGRKTGITSIQLPKPRRLTGRLMLNYNPPDST